MLSCREVTEKASEYIDQNMPLGQRINFQMHLFMCKHCRQYLKQMRGVISIVKLHQPKISNEQAQQIVDRLLQHPPTHYKQDH